MNLHANRPSDEHDLEDLHDLANVIRGLTIDAVETAGHGHPGAAMGMADIATVLYAHHLRFHGPTPDWPDRDRVLLSNGHAAILHYALLHLTGVPGMDLDQIRSFRRAGSLTPGHPEVGHTPGIEATTGPLGQGIGMATGFAMAEARLRAEFGDDLCDHRTWVFAGDGCLMEGVGQEAASLAGHLGLGRLNLLYDRNRITIDGATDLSFSEDTAAKFAAMGWHVLAADGHDFVAIDDALAHARAETSRPSIILFETVIGRGAPTKAGTSAIHGSKLGIDEAAAAKAALGLPPDPFDIPQDRLERWSRIGQRGATDVENWTTRLHAVPFERRTAFEARLTGALPAGFDDFVSETKMKIIRYAKPLATRAASQVALATLTKTVPAMIGGSADLTGSNLTATEATAEAFAAGRTGRYVNYGVREFAMAAAMNGLALHGGFVPYGGTFLVFSDYMRNAVRLSALMRTKVLYVFTHDSIGLGEDGPTHQPIEHLASLRAMPGLHLFRPADAVETMEAYAVALTLDGPSAFALSRQGTPPVRATDGDENLTARGGYVIREADGPRHLTILATGTEVALAIKAAETLATEGVDAAVVSLPSWSLFEKQDQSYRASVLGAAPRLSVEAASSFGWSRYVPDPRGILSVDGFGASASAAELYAGAGLTTDAIAARGRELAR